MIDVKLSVDLVCEIAISGEPRSACRCLSLFSHIEGLLDDMQCKLFHDRECSLYWDFGTGHYSLSVLLSCVVLPL
jgi:hypothetical protein